MEKSTTLDFTVSELVDLALCTPEIGAVNFNILRLLLHDIVQKLGIDSLAADLEDVETNQVEKYKSYLTGNPNNTPMPGVLRVTPPGFSYAVKSVHGPGQEQGKEIVAQTLSMDKASSRTPRSARGMVPESGALVRMAQLSASRQGQGQPGEAVADPNSARTDELEDKVSRLERHLEALYQLPTNQQLLDLNKKVGSDGVTSAGATGGGMTVNDMWQIIQLNNRVASCESAIQKMATLIEDLATDVHGVKGATSNFQTDAANILESHGRLSTEMMPLHDKCLLVQEALDALKSDLAKIQHEWKVELDKVTKVTGLDPQYIPSFLRPTPSQSGAPSRTQSTHRKQKDKSKKDGQREDKEHRSADPDDDRRRSQERDRRSQDQSRDRRSQDYDQDRDRRSQDYDHNRRSQDYDEDYYNSDKDEDHSHHRHSRDRSSRRSGGTSPKSDSDRSGAPDIQMSPESVALMPVAKLEKLSPTDLDQLSDSNLDLMTPEEIDKVTELRRLLPPPELNYMSPERIQRLRIEQLEKLSSVDAQAIKPSKLVHMNPEQRDKIEEIRKRKVFDFEQMDSQKISEMDLQDLQQMDLYQAVELREDILKQMTPDQRQVIHALKQKATFIGIRSITDQEAKRDESAQELDMGPETDGPRRSSARQSQGQRQSSAGQGQRKSSAGQALRKSQDQQEQDQDQGQGQRKSEDRSPQPRQGQGRSSQDTERGSRHPSKHKGKGHHGPSQGPSHHGHGHQGYSPVDIYRGKVPPEIVASQLQLELDNMDPSEAKKMVQTEIQKQYVHLQEQQRQLARDIQSKMELIYDKLLKEIVTTKQEAPLPYMSEGQEHTMGPGVCTTYSLPGGVAVCQFPEAEKTHPAPGHEGAKVCPGPGMCPGIGCPHCSPGGKPGEPTYMKPPPSGSQPVQAGAPGQGQLPVGQPGTDAPRLSTGEANPVGMTAYVPGQLGPEVSPEQTAALMETMRSLILVDLDAIRDSMKNREGTHFDEGDILERLDTIWEAIKIIKSNEETLAVKILRQDAILKKIPNETLDKLHLIPIENLDAIATANWDKPMMLPSKANFGGTSRPGAHQSRLKVKDKSSRHETSTQSNSSFDKDEVQTIYNNLANLMAESIEQKDRLERIGDLVHTMEVGMVTKQTLVDALGDKLDKGQINTKVSYDEFGTAIEELHTALRDIILEGYQRNEHWSQVTEDLGHGVNAKLDKTELTPLKAFFRSNLKALDEKVKVLQRQMEEPDPAGTRKKLLRDFNCLSCDRHCNISGVTNGPTLPLLGPIPARHPNASKRAFDLHRLRMRKKFDHDCRDMLMIERQMRSMGLLNPDGSVKQGSEIPVVTRYQGGSHTMVTTKSQIRANKGHRSSCRYDSKQQINCPSTYAPEPEPLPPLPDRCQLYPPPQTAEEEESLLGPGEDEGEDLVEEMGDIGMEEGLELDLEREEEAFLQMEQKDYIEASYIEE